LKEIKQTRKGRAKKRRHELKLMFCDKLENVSALGLCSVLHTLYLNDCPQLVDISALSQCSAPAVDAGAFCSVVTLVVNWDDFGWVFSQNDQSTTSYILYWWYFGQFDGRIVHV
jgi:hypothetical protein